MGYMIETMPMVEPVPKIVVLGVGGNEVSGDKIGSGSGIVS